jgi:hypothetical protein
MKMAMKAELAPVAARDLQIIEYRGQRVVTTEQLAAGYGATEQMITNNFTATNPGSLKVNITSSFLAEMLKFCATLSADCKSQAKLAP